MAYGNCRDTAEKFEFDHYVGECFLNGMCVEYQVNECGSRIRLMYRTDVDSRTGRSLDLSPDEAEKFWDKIEEEAGPDMMNGALYLKCTIDRIEESFPTSMRL